MVIQRITILCVTFFLVALSTCPAMALLIFLLGVFTYSALWCYDIFKRKEKQ